MNREELEAAVRRALTQRDRALGNLPWARNVAADNAFITTVLQAADCRAHAVSEAWARQHLSGTITTRDLGDLRMAARRPPTVQAQVHRHAITTLTVRMAARQIGVSERTVTRWRKALRENVPAPGYPEPAGQSDHDH
jgi:hypothetical protein